METVIIKSELLKLKKKNKYLKTPFEILLLSKKFDYWINYNNAGILVRIINILMHCHHIVFVSLFPKVVNKETKTFYLSHEVKSSS
jgi:hypothetical protein